MKYSNHLKSYFTEKWKIKSQVIRDSNNPSKGQFFKKEYKLD